MFKQFVLLFLIVIISSGQAQIREFNSFIEDGNWKQIVTEEGNSAGNRGEFIIKKETKNNPARTLSTITLTINFNTDQTPDFVIFNQDDAFGSGSGTWSPDHYTFTVDVPEGIYDMIFVDFAHTSWVVKEQIACSSATVVNVHFVNDPVYTVTLSGVDNNGIVLDTYPRPSRIGITLFAPAGSMVEYVSIFNLNKEILHFSGLSDRFKIYLDEFQDAIFESKEYWVVQFDMITGLNSNVLVRNNPSEFRHQKIVLNNKATDYYFVSFSHDFIERHEKINGGVSMNFMFMDSIPNYSADVYITTDKSNRISYSTKMGYFESNGLYPTMPGYFGQSMFVKDNTNNIFSSFLPVHTPDVYESVSGSSFNLGTGPVYPYMFYPNNYYGTVNIGSNPRFCGSLMEYRVSDNLRSTYSITNSDNAVISSGELSNFQAIDVPAGIYKFVTVNPFVKVNGRDAVSKVITTFDLTKVDATPPFITSYKLMNSEGVFTDVLAKGEAGQIKFSSGDFYVDPDPDNLTYKPIDGTQTKAYYRLSNTTDWIQLTHNMSAEHSLVGFVYTAQIPAAITNHDSADIDIKISFTDQSGNKTELEMSPAFTVLLPVPVEMISFNAVLQGSEAVLNWSTASELNNKGFYIERQYMSGEWLSVEFINGSGTVTETKSYTFKDKLEHEGKYVYRLKQMDYDGTFNYSSEIEVIYEIPGSFLLDQNYPNPFNPSTTINFEIPSTSEISLKIYDVLGNEVKTILKEQKEKGSYSIIFEAENLSSGIYFYTLQAGSFTQTKKLILMK